MVDTREILPDIAFKGELITLCEFLEPVDGGMSPFPLASGIGVMNEGRIEDRFRLGEEFVASTA